MPEQDISLQIQERVTQARQTGTALCIRGGGSKDFYGRKPVGERLELSAHRGIVSYEPTELVITARAGTTLQELEQTLAEAGQLLPFEPPHFGSGATLGGTIACNLSGPRRGYTGAARDFVLGTRLINGSSEILSFGGEVMKNVAGYDVSRLMCGAMGTLGILLEISLKVLPAPKSEITLMIETDLPNALETIHDWTQKPYPITATCYDGDSLFVRLSGGERAVEAARNIMGGEILLEADNFWRRLREHEHGFFDPGKPLWRLSVASDTPLIDLPGKWLYEWGGAQRWLISDASSARIRDAAVSAGGHATYYRGNDREQVFQPLSQSMAFIHKRLKHAFDPEGLFNPGRIYENL
jgi:glycolate oxidase FAD binding subunit